MRVFFGLLAVSALGVVASACGGDDNPANSTPVSSLTVDLSNWAVKPSATTLAAGKVSFTISHAMYHGGMNATDGGATHQLVVAPLEAGAKDGQNKYGKPLLNVTDLKPGDTKTQDVELTPGTYELACLIVEDLGGGKSANHYEKGMHTTVVVK